jgi:predicted TIM-barrel fold metal-dependent hydrolase
VSSADFRQILIADESAVGKNKLNVSLQKWQAEKRRGIWFRMEICDNWWFPVLLAAGFKVHHAREEYVMLKKWMVDGVADTLPMHVFF